MTYLGILMCRVDHLSSPLNDTDETGSGFGFDAVFLVVRVGVRVG